MCFLYWERILEQTEESRNKYMYGVVTQKTKKKWMNLQKEYLVPLIKRRMNLLADKEIDGIPLYITRLFNHFCDQKNSINLSCFQIEIEFMDESLSEILFKESDDGVFVVNLDALNAVLPNMRSYIDAKGESNVFSKK